MKEYNMILPLGARFRGEVEEDIRILDRNFRSEIFEYQNHRNSLAEAAFSQVIIALYDLVQKSKIAGFPITFTEDVDIEPTVGHITDLIAKFRDCVAHPTSGNRYVSNTDIKITFCRIWGICHLMKTPNKEIKGEYANDMCFVYGGYKIYLNRHIVRAYNVACANLAPFIQSHVKIETQPYIYVGPK